MKLSRRVFARLSAALATPVFFSACAPFGADTKSVFAPNTGSIDLEQEVGALSPSQAVAGLKVFVYNEHLNVRSTPEVADGDVVGVLEMNDKVEIVDPELIGPQQFVAIRVIESKTPVPKGQTLYTSYKFLDGSPRKLSGEKAAASKLFIVTNIATETTRVYQRCEPGEGCVNRLLFEQDVVNGEDDNGTRTSVGTYRITSWEKFYETPGVYPAWYKAGYPAPPPPGNRRAWLSSSYMPGGKGDMRGAFGWYTMKVGPNPAGQWMHGTAGWGADKKNFILFKNTGWGQFINLFASIRSHGCTRIDNETIAYLRSLLPIGTTYVKIYAREGQRSKASYPEKSWSYILTTVGGGQTNNHQLADRSSVLASGTPKQAWLDQGTLAIDQTPSARAGDLYGIGKDAFQGVFIVDEGTVSGYQHPRHSKVGRGGFPDGQLPSVMSSRPTITYR